MANSTSIAFVAKPYLVFNGGIYIAKTKQSKSLSSFELKPYVGVRFVTKVEKRFVLANLSRFEFRDLKYSDNTSNSSFRFRNKTTLLLAINHKSNLLDNTISVFGYFEAFGNSDEEVIERYFTILKYKVGLRYRFSPHRRVNIGTLFNQAKNIIVDPVQAPANIIANVILEWGVVFAIQ